MITRNTEWLEDQYGREYLQHGLIKVQMAKLKSMELYQNNFPATLQELVDYTEMGDSRGDNLQILHPTNILLRKATFE